MKEDPYKALGLIVSDMIERCDRAALTNLRVEITATLDAQGATEWVKRCCIMRVETFPVRFLVEWVR